MKKRTSLLILISLSIIAFSAFVAFPRQGRAGTFRWKALKNATYRGLTEIKGEVTLSNGVWKGKPFVEGGASRPSVRLNPMFLRQGDLTGDGKPEACVLLSENNGGSGVYVDLAVVSHQGNDIHNIATTFIGDRVQVIDGKVTTGKVVLTLLQQGPNDPSCCPGDLVRRTWKWTGKTLEEAKGKPARTRLSLAFLNGTTWFLNKWPSQPTLPKGVKITLHFNGHTLTGTCGCNQYAVTVKEGELPGEIKAIRTVLTTRKHCSPSLFSLQKHYLRDLRGTHFYGFYGGKLTLSYQTKDEYGMLLFEKVTAP